MALTQRVPAANPEVGAFSTSFGAAKMKPCDEIPLPASSIGKSLLTTPLIRHDMGSRPMERGETSSRPSLQYAKRVLKSVLSSWIETLSSDHLGAGFGMIKPVQEILVEREKVGLDVISAKAFVDEVIALGNKWIETESFPNGDFFREMFLKPFGEVKFELDEISWTRKQFVRERNITELAIIELIQDLHRLDREVVEFRQRLELLEEQAVAKWTAIVKARAREGLSFARLKRSTTISGGRL